MKIRGLLCGLAVVVLGTGCNAGPNAGSGSGVSANTSTSTGTSQEKAVEVTLGKYKGVEVEELAIPISAEEVEKEIQRELKANSPKEEVTDRPVEQGDIVNIDFLGKKDGVAFEGGASGQGGYDLEIGSGSFIAGFEEGIVGHKTGETFDLNLTFPKDYSSAELAGQEVVFTVTVNKISKYSKILEFTDEYVQSVSKEDKTAEEYRKSVKKRMLSEIKRVYAQDIEEKAFYDAWTKIVEGSSISELPEEMVNEAYRVQSLNYQAMNPNLTIEEIAKQNGETMEEVETKLRETAKSNVKELLIMQKIAEEEKLEVSDEEIEQQISAYVTEYGETARTRLDKETVRRAVLGNKVRSLIMDNLVRK